ncbi:hypothetical protein SAMN03159488_03065 [Pseudomonas sp. NFIX10]|uniref:hypothetical protein n=1 Tax=unclassified Pseudomonas TaxID=196821 RepID=UPI0008F39CEA|nr:MULTISPECIES: hypothetical protein [unclassified Pseudomonas]SFB33007.1 hypothetical protein SAMN03159488_03065 [Pseudomonas sp. NFIX10]SFE99301.1 hypothetical protein SAMN03159367_02730 [Pseudomonas sp. NFACC06-1]
MTKQAHKNHQNLIINGTFDNGLEGWSARQVTWAGGRARFAPNGNLSQTVSLNAPGTVKLLFNVSSYYGVGGVRLSAGGVYCSINRAGPYEVDFTVDSGNSVDLIFTSQGAYDVDDVEFYFEEAECQPVQLLQNGGFDNGLEGWDYDGEINIVDGQAHFSERSRLFQQIAIKPGTPIVVRYSCRTSIRCSVSCGIPEYNFSWFSVNPEWITKAYTFAAPEGVTPTLVHVEFRLFSSSQPQPTFLHVDDVEVWACPAEAGAMTKIRHDLWSIE